jgi:hypothetical protein
MDKNSIQAKNLIDWASQHYNPAASKFSHRSSFFGTLKFW